MRSLIKRKRADLTGVLFLIVSIAAFAIFILIVSFIGQTLGTELDAKMNSTHAEADQEISKAFGKTVDVSKTSLQAIWFILFGLLLIGLIITAWFVPTHPIFAPAFIILLIVVVIVGMALSNAYEELAKTSQLSGAALEQPVVGFVMGLLPYIGLIIGLLVLIITFAKPGGGNEAVSM